jgi:hypothetical protein
MKYPFLNPFSHIKPLKTHEISIKSSLSIDLMIFLRGIFWWQTPGGIEDLGSRVEQPFDVLPLWQQLGAQLGHGLPRCHVLRGAGFSPKMGKS